MYNIHNPVAWCVWNIAVKLCAVFCEYMLSVDSIYMQNDNNIYHLRFLLHFDANIDVFFHKISRLNIELSLHGD